jgi:phosphate transport system substrate-binding protein
MPERIYRVGMFLLVMLLAVLLAACGDAAKGGSGVSSDAEPNRAIQNKGSDTLVNLALAWAEEYRVVDPSV